MKKGRGLRALLTVLVLLVTAGGAQAAGFRDHNSSMKINLLGLPTIQMQAKPGAQIFIHDSGSITVPERIFEYKGTLVPDYDGIPFTFNAQGTNLDTRVIKSVQVSLHNQEGLLQHGGYIRAGAVEEFGGALQLSGFFRFKFRPFLKRESDEILNSTPTDVTIPAWIVGYSNTQPPYGNGIAMSFWPGGANWRTGYAETIVHSAPLEELNIESPTRNYTTNINWRSSQRGSPMSWTGTDGDHDGYGTVTLVSPVHIHHRELWRRQLQWDRFYTLPAYTTLQMEIMPVVTALAPPAQTGLPSLAGAVGLAAFGVAKRRRRSH